MNTSLVLAFILVFILFLVAIWTSLIKDDINRNKLIRSGFKIDARVMYISKQVTPTIRSAGNSAVYQIHCEGRNPMTGVIQNFVSRVLKFQPDINIQQNPNIDIYIDKGNLNNYYVDIRNVKVLFDKPNQIGYYISTDGVNYEKKS